jgi:hypothetical protein
MPLYDHRVFRHRDEWWVAQVHSASGAGRSPQIPITHDRVTFTCLSDAKRDSKTASITTGLLNQMDHSSLVKVLGRAEPYGARFEMSPFNAPDVEQLGNLAVTKDDEGLRWVVRRLPPTLPETVALVEVICLDDSALKREIVLRPETVYDDAKLMAPFDVDTELVKLVKSTFRAYESTKEFRERQQ